jgi:DNA-binding winged helix-turn-helix (wHTH) protein
MQTSTGRVIQLTDGRDIHALRAPAGPADAAADFHIDGWLVQPSLNRITRGEITVRIRPQVMDLLVCLASHPGKVFGRGELRELVWDGRWIAESAVSRCVTELRAALADSARRPRVIETIAKRGYRVIATVEAGREPTRPFVVPVATAGPAACERRPPRFVWRWLRFMHRRLTSGTASRD